MLLRKFKSNPGTMMRFGRIFLWVGMLIFVAGISWQRLPFHASLSPALNDLFQGFTMGLGISLEVLSVFIVKKAYGLKPRNP